jgi:hypothetical protein
MTTEQKETVFEISYWSAAVLYVWGIVMIWVGPQWGLSGWTFYFAGVLPAVLAVVSLATALGLYLDLYKSEE